MSAPVMPAPRVERERPTSVAAPRRSASRTLSTIALLVVAAAFLLPLAWLVLAAVDPAATYETRLPERFSLENFEAVLTPQTTFIPLGNSLLLSTATAGITVIVALLAAYPLSRYRSRFHRGVMYGVLFGTCLPITAIMVPVYSLFVVVGLLDSMIGTILFLTASSLPMAVFMTKNFMDSVPVSLEEAAWIDGASAMRALRTVVIPSCGRASPSSSSSSSCRPGATSSSRSCSSLPREAAGGDEHLHLLRPVRIDRLRPAGRLLDPVLGTGHRSVHRRAPASSAGRSPWPARSRADTPRKDTRARHHPPHRGAHRPLPARRARAGPRAIEDPDAGRSLEGRRRAGALRARHGAALRAVRGGNDVGSRVGHRVVPRHGRGPAAVGDGRRRSRARDRSRLLRPPARLPGRRDRLRPGRPDDQGPRAPDRHVPLGSAHRIELYIEAAANPNIADDSASDRPRSGIRRRRGMPRSTRHGRSTSCCATAPSSSSGTTCTPCGISSACSPRRSPAAT